MYIQDMLYLNIVCGKGSNTTIYDSQGSLFDETLLYLKGQTMSVLLWV